MATRPAQQVWTRFALGGGVLLFIVALRQTDWTSLLDSGTRSIVALLAAIVASGLWHIVRTVAWWTAFPGGGAPSFRRLFRVRLSAEAVSYVTWRGVGGEPLKVLLLSDRADPRTATAAVALERGAYLAVTVVIVGAAASVALVIVPLDPEWRIAFRVFAGIGWLSLAGIVAVLRGRGRAFAWLRFVGAPGSRRARVGRFIADVEQHVLLLARDDRRRVTVLAACAALSYVLMALEAWLVFRVMQAPITIGQAFALETFTRVASFASAVIPGNLGALEAAHLAAAAAVGAPSGAMLGLARRGRGIAWALLGFLTYPRIRDRASGREPAVTGAGHPEGQMFVYVASDPRVAACPLLRLGGLAIAQRMVVAALRAGYARVYVVDDGRRLRGLERLGAGVHVVDAHRLRRLLAARDATEWVTASGPGLVVSPALFARAALIEGATAEALDVPASGRHPVSGLLRTTVRVARDSARLADLVVSAVWRADDLPTGVDVANGRALLAVRVVTPSGRAAADATLRRSVFKETDARVARFNRRLSLPLSVALVPTAMTANLMSLFIVTLGIAAAWLFARGEYLAGVVGAVVSLVASVLDGCDGEIARLTYEESKLGCWLETIGDYAYYLAIFAGLTVGAVRQTGLGLFTNVGVIALGGTLASFALLIFLRRRITAGRPEMLHAIARARFLETPTWWSRLVWRVSFVATRSAMPYGILALALVNLLPLVVVLAAVGANIYWVSLVLKLPDLLGEAVRQKTRQATT